MNSKQAQEFIKKYPGAKSFVKASHLEELSPLLEVHIEAITCTKDEFHELEGGKTYMPRKETLDKFAAAAGVSYNTIGESTRKEGDGCYVGRSQAMVTGPDGKMIAGDVCEYEFDVDVRLEEIKINGAADWEHKNGSRPGRKEHTPQELAKERVNLQKVARQRANTGARSRATLAVLGMQTGFKGLFDKNEPATATRVFLFSRIIVNAKNELVMNRMLDNLGPNVAMLYGASPSVQALPAAARPAPEPEEPPMRNATPAPGDDFDDIPFGDEPVVTPKLSAVIAALSDWTNCADERIAGRASALLDSGDTRLDVLEPALEILKYLSQFKPGEKVRGGSDCVAALDMRPLDPIVLQALATKVRGLQQGAA